MKKLLVSLILLPMLTIAAPAQPTYENPLLAESKQNQAVVEKAAPRPTVTVLEPQKTEPKKPTKLESGWLMQSEATALWSELKQLLSEWKGSKRRAQ